MSAAEFVAAGGERARHPLNDVVDVVAARQATIA